MISGRAGTSGQAFASAPSGPIGIAGDVEALENWRQDECCQVAGGKRGDHGYGGHHHPQGEDGLDALAGYQDSVACPKRTPFPLRLPRARRGVAIGALPHPNGSSHVR